MSRRRRPGPPRTASPPPDPAASRLRAPLAALFPDGLPPPPPPPPPAPRLVSEQELMARAFAALATGEPLDLDAVRVVAHMPFETCPQRHAPSDSQRRGAHARPRSPSVGRASGHDGPVAGARPASAPPGAASGAGPGDAGRAPPGPAARPGPLAPSPAETAPPGAPSRELAALQTRCWAGSGWRDAPRPTREQARAAAELVTRARRGRLPTLRLRGLRREPALAALAAFVARERAARSRYVRVVTGKGLGSPGDPVLKEAVAEWCASPAGEAEVSAWAPELDVRGEYGSVILQLRPFE